jgi:shikimate dehydrogenase
MFIICSFPANQKTLARRSQSIINHQSKTLSSMQPMNRQSKIVNQKSKIPPRLYGLTGYPLSHSFSPAYFAGKFAGEGLVGYSYRSFPMEDISQIRRFIERQPDLCGLNVTIPYKERIIPYLDELDAEAGQIEAVNTVVISRRGKEVFLKGYNTDIYGFTQSLKDWLSGLGASLPEQAFVLGTGGASKAVAYGLRSMAVQVHFISRNAGAGVYKTYEQLNRTDMEEHRLIVNASPLGMYPDTGRCPDIPYQYLSKNHLLYDLVYNPEETLFMKKGQEAKTAVTNGKRMLFLQADKAWEIWQNNK